MSDCRPRRVIVSLCVALLSCVGLGWSQDDSVSAPSTQAEQGAESLTSSAQPIPSSIPPVQPLPGLEARFVEQLSDTRSFFAAGAYITEGVESTTSTGLSSSQDTRLLGSLHLLRVQKNSQTEVDYIGGGSFSRENSDVVDQQRLSVEHSLFWRTGQITFGDSFGNYTGGSFGSAWFGGASAYGLRSGDVVNGVGAGGGLFFGSSNLGGLGASPHLTNLTQTSVVQALNKQSAISFGAGYSKTFYFDDTQNLIDSQQISGLASYTLALNKRTQVGLVYGYRSLRFPQTNDGTVSTHLAQLTYFHHFSRRLSLQLAGGPELANVHRMVVLGIGPELELSFDVKTKQINASASTALVYRMRRTTTTVSYDRLVTTGSGLFAGANTNIVQLSVARPLSRILEIRLDSGFERLSHIDQKIQAIPTNSFQYWFAGAALTRTLGPSISIVGSYQFNNQHFGADTCSLAATCGRSLQRHVAFVALYWHIRPIRLDRGNQSTVENRNNQPTVSTNDSWADRDTPF